MEDAIDEDNERHRREEAARRARRQKHRESKSKGQSEKERKRREHAQRILGAQKTGGSRGGRPAPPPKKSSKTDAASAAAAAAGGSSAFQRLFQSRAEGFFIDLRFRNAPPRPPVGPTFVGLGLEGELTDKWTKYKARNAVERQYAWKLHPDKYDLGVPLAASAMDFENCYTDPAKGEKNNKEGGGEDEKGNKKKHVVPVLAPEDEALINWKGGTGDTAAERLQQRQDQRRAAARAALARGHGAPSAAEAASAVPRAASSSGATGGGGSAFRLKKKHHLHSRILDERTPNFMKKTTYLTNDATSVHQFKSLADEKSQRARDVDRALAETRTRYTEMDVVEKGFRDANHAEAAGKTKRAHPTKPTATPVWDVPLLPDVSTWGQTYAHVVLDNPPKTVDRKATQRGKEGEGDRAELFRPQRLGGAIVTDVAKQAENARMACTVWVPRPPAMSEGSEAEGSAPPAKKSKWGRPYAALQRYDLDVAPLRDSSDPHVHYVWIVDPAGGRAGYHPVGSRVHLSTGRPVVAEGAGGEEATATTESYVLHRAMGEGERKAMEVRTAAVDVDLAERHGLVAEDDEEAEEEEAAGGAADGKQQGSAEVEADAS